MKKAFLLAHPAGHSLSPAMHNAAFQALGLSGRYEAWDVAPEDLEASVHALRAPDVWGANVTVPHKRAVLPFLDAASAEAKSIGAVNTVVNNAGRLTGHNTDAAGFLRALREDARFELQGARVVMLGAGGAARAVAYALLSAGVRDLVVLNRTRDKAERLVEDFASLGPIRAADVETVAEDVRLCDLLVNTTSVGMEQAGRDPDVSPLEPGLLPLRGLVCDIVYRPARTRLLREAEAAGLKGQNGLPMLVYQGAEAFTFWTGRAAPVRVMEKAARDALARA